MGELLDLVRRTVREFDELHGEDAALAEAVALVGTICALSFVSAFLAISERL